MEGPLSFMQIDPACLLLLVLGFSLLDYMVNNWSSEQKEDGANLCVPPTYALARRYRSIKKRSEDETPLARSCGLRHLQLRHRVKLLGGVKRRLDQQF